MTEQQRVLIDGQPAIPVNICTCVTVRGKLGLVAAFHVCLACDSQVSSLGGAEVVRFHARRDVHKLVWLTAIVG